MGDHRGEREAGRLVYPVLSRRSGGLSVGVNLFPDRKLCNFDCPYCEVFLSSEPGPRGRGFDPRELEEELEVFLEVGYPEAWAPEPVRDLCISGNGEPTLSPFLGAAIEACAAARRKRPGLLGRAELVLITNATGFLSPSVSALLEAAVAREGLVIWAKLDGATPEAFRRMSRSRYALDEVAAGIASFAARNPVIVQTMLCRSGGAEPSLPELEAYAALLGRLVEGGARIRALQLYTKARPSPGEPPGQETEGLADGRLAELAALVASRLPIPVRAFGASGELVLP